MSNFKRFLSLALALLMAMSLLLTVVSCGNAGDGATTDGGTQAGTTDESATESPYQQLEKEQYNRDFVVMTRDDCVDDFVVEEQCYRDRWRKTGRYAFVKRVYRGKTHLCLDSHSCT